MSSLWMVALVAGAAVGLGVGALVYLVAVPQRPALAPLMKLAGSRPPPALSIAVLAPAAPRRRPRRACWPRSRSGWTSTG